jgi:hypothetical protein
MASFKLIGMRGRATPLIMKDILLTFTQSMAATVIMCTLFPRLLHGPCMREG